jgi:hypothetical protein
MYCPKEGAIGRWQPWTDSMKNEGWMTSKVGQGSTPMWCCGTIEQGRHRCSKEAPLEWEEWEYVCRLMPKSQNCGVREVPQRHLLLHNSLLEQVAVATNTYTATEELLGAIIFNQTDRKLYKQNQTDPAGESQKQFTRMTRTEQLVIAA